MRRRDAEQRRTRRGTGAGAKPAPWLRTTGTVLLAAAWACAPGDSGRTPPPAPSADPDTASPDAPHTQLPPRAATVEDTILIEGMPEPVRLQLFRSPAGAAVPFSTYVPQGIHAAVEAPGDTLSVRFSAAFAGDPHPNAYMQVRFHPAGTSRERARTEVMGFLRSRAPGGEEAQSDDPPSWADEAWSFRYRGDGGVLHFGRAILATHGGRIFHVLIHYPAEFGDGLGPRFARMLDEWRWEDTGAMLTR